MYEPATSSQLENLLKNLRLADIQQRLASETGDQTAADAGADDTSFMILFGGKDSERDILFNDIYFLGIP